MIKTIQALLRVRKLMRIEAAGRRALKDIDIYDRRMNGTGPDYRDARPPTGDDYNAVLAFLGPLEAELDS